MNLVLFFSYGASLQYWHDTGLLEREIKLYKKLVKKGVHITFLTYGDENDLKFSSQLGDIRILPVYSKTYRPKNRYLAFLHSLFLPWILRKNLTGADVYKTNQMSGSWVAFIAKLLYRKKLVLRCGYELYRFSCRQRVSYFKQGAIYLLEMIAYRLADIIFITADDEKDYITKKFYISKQSINIIPNFVETTTFNPKANKNQSNKNVLFIGRLSAQKNILSLIDALRETDIQLDIVGNGELRKIITEYASSQRVSLKFFGNNPKDELPDLINKYEIFVLPSLYEGNPKVLLEAMSCGLAVIGTKVSGIQNIIQHGVNGLLCETSSNSIKHAIQRLIADKNLKRELGFQAREYIIKNNELDLIASKEYVNYLELLSQQKDSSTKYEKS